MQIRVVNNMCVDNIYVSRGRLFEPERICVKEFVWDTLKIDWSQIKVLVNNKEI